MGHSKDIATGCRPDQLFGLWAIEPERFGRMVAIVKSADLAQLRAEAAAAAAIPGFQAPPLYTVGNDGIAQIELNGPMTKYPTSFSALLGGTSTLRTREALRAAVRDPEVHGIMLVVDSPGGSVAGTADLAADVRLAASRKPLHGYAADQATSAALWAISGARKVWSNANAEIGSIGAFRVVEDTSEQFKQDGVKVHVISSAPPLKGAGVDGTEVTPPQLAEWERRARDQADLMVSELAAARRLPKEKVQSLATGQVWVAEQARQHGLIDGVVSLDEAMRLLRSEAMEDKDVKAGLELAKEQEMKAAEEKAARLKVEARAEALEKQVALLVTKERSARFAAEAKEISAPVEFAEVLEKVEAAVGAEVYGKLHTQLKAYHAQVQAGDAFKERGTTGAGGGQAGTALAQLNAKATELMAKGEAKDFYAAFALACERHPALVKQERAERSGSN